MVYLSRILYNRIYICMEQHLAENEIALYVDALIADRQVQLPQEILEHVEECFECKVEIVEVLRLVESSDRVCL